MTTTEPSAATTTTVPSAAIVVGASRGLGRGIAAALAGDGRPVLAVSRGAAAERSLVPDAGTITPVRADAADPATATELIAAHRPGALVIVAGTVPQLAPLHEQTWETFSANWHADVRIAFEWLKASLAGPLAPGSRVVVISSGAAVAGSPLSGGYAGAKATQRSITAYAREESDRAGLGITFTAVLPRITPLTDVGRPAVAAYAARAGRTLEEHTAAMGPPLTPERTGAAVLELLKADAAGVAPAYLLTADGLRALT